MTLLSSILSGEYFSKHNRMDTETCSSLIFHISDYM